MSQPGGEESTSKGSGRNHFGSSENSERNPDPIPVAAKCRQSRPHGDSSNGGDSTASSVPDIASPNINHRSGRCLGEGEKPRSREEISDEESWESTTRWSSDDDQEPAKGSTRPTDDLKKRKNEGRRDREYARRISRNGDSFRRSNRPWRRESSSDSDRCSGGRRRMIIRKGSTKERPRCKYSGHKNSQNEYQSGEDTGEAEFDQSSLSSSDVEERWSSDPSSCSDYVDSRSSTRRRVSNERPQLYSEAGRARERNRHKSAIEESSEAAAWRKNRRNSGSSWDANLMSDTGGKRLRRHSSSALDQKRRGANDANADDMKHQATLCTDTNTHKTSSKDSSVDCTERSHEQGWPQPATGQEDDPSCGMARDADGGRKSFSPSSDKGLNLHVEKVANKPPTTGEVATAGKPIRGARWGEAIGIRSKVFDTKMIPKGRMDVRDFILSPLRSGPGTVLRCFVERNRSGAYSFSKVYSMYADLEDGSGRLLLAARKLLTSRMAYFIICARQDDLFTDSGKRGGNSFLGKLRATSAAHTEYVLYDRGDNPESKCRATPSDYANAKSLKQGNRGTGELRRELGFIAYNFDKKEQRTGKRRMEVAIPQILRQGDAWGQVLWQPSDAKDGMKPSFSRVRYEGAQNLLEEDRLLAFHQRESRYDPLSSCLVDFRGRATAPSVKNFQLIKSTPEDDTKRARYYCEGAGRDEHESDDLPRPVFLQMGKVGKNCFNVDVEWPLSLLQAFAICLSRFDTNAHF